MHTAGKNVTSLVPDAKENVGSRAGKNVTSLVPDAKENVGSSTRTQDRGLE